MIREWLMEEPGEADASPWGLKPKRLEKYGIRTLLKSYASQPATETAFTSRREMTSYNH